VHPCKHSDVLKKFIDDAKRNNKKIKPHQTLLIFLKFMGSVMPTVEYDNTLDMEL
jgi:ubiquitin-like-conjugating enzyme ATG3